jgi:hypothetical protein
MRLLRGHERNGDGIGFILPPRTGTRSVESALVSLHALPIGTRHHVPDPLPPAKLTVATIRNPFDVIVSWFHFPDPDYRNRGPAVLALGGNGRTWAEWLEFVLSGQHKFMATSTLRGAKLADRVIRFEDGIERQLHAILSEYGYVLPPVGHIGKSARQAYQGYYSPRQIVAVYRKFKDDFKRFGYRFE